MSFSSSDYAADTDFERYVLDLLGTHRVRYESPGAVHDARSAAGIGNITVYVGAADSGLGARDKLATSLRPLGFGAAYKVLDLLVEHALRANNVQPRRRFDQKVAALGTPLAALPVPLNARPELWERLSASTSTDKRLATRLHTGAHVSQLPAILKSSTSSGA